MTPRYTLAVFFLLVFIRHIDGSGFCCNLGTQTTHLLDPKITVQLMKDNGFEKVKLFESDGTYLEALAGSKLQVMVGVPNYLLSTMATKPEAADEYVANNVTHWRSKDVDIRHVAVGNEPFLKSYGGNFTNYTFPALQNIQGALEKAGLGKTVKATIPFNADIFYSPTGSPSGAIFRPDIQDLMVSIVKYMSEHGCPITVNIYPFIALYYDPSFPIDYGFFDGGVAPLVDGKYTYTNALDANFDTLVVALEKNGYGSLPIIIGEIGWPSDGNPNANASLAQRFYQGLVKRVRADVGTPRRSTAPDIYMFSLIDEDAKSIAPGPFEPHWGIFNIDGSMKFSLDLGDGKKLTGAKGVEYLEKQWCVVSPDANVNDEKFGAAITEACSHADCTALTPGGSCGSLDLKGNASFAFNMYFQTNDQKSGSCEKFQPFSMITKTDPSAGTCKYPIMFKTDYRGGEQGHVQHGQGPESGSGSGSGSSSSAGKINSGVVRAVMLAMIMVFGYLN
ncbi:UNVERIFIED_CONTAM: Glucan endo-1,3-beta-glucosidase 5 [Sesamum radiatum]|uniref:glucan endo-1,3-beta-D-glucosidase n=1 Tax=Sesamum radiatum TaxID=300843 RepID=A0AAW2NP37_SESRA